MTSKDEDNNMTSVHLIHIGDREERKRAIEAFLDVPETWTSFPGNVLGVTGKHIAALRKLNPPVKFEPAQKAHLNGQNPTVQPT
jgi:hypothetical protein